MRQRDPDMSRFDNVGVRYGVGDEVLRDLSFSLEPGSFQFLTGPSGAGKTSVAANPARPMMKPIRLAIDAGACGCTCSPVCSVYDPRQ